MGSGAGEREPGASRVHRVRHLRRYLAGAVLLATAVAVPPSTRTEALTPTRFVSGWIPYWESDWTRPFDMAPGILADVSPMAFQMNEVSNSADPLAVFIEQTMTKPGALDAIVSRARAAGALVIPSIFDQTNNNVMAQVIADPIRRLDLVTAIAALVNNRGFDGIDLDWENFAFNDSSASKALVYANWPIFLTDLKAAMQPTGKILSVTVPPIWTKTTVNDTTKSPATCSFANELTTDSCRGYRMYNWPATIGIVDRFRIMIYDWSVSQAGPIAPRWWYQDVITLLQTRFPSYLGRVQLGVPAYGRNWAKVQSGTCPDGTSLATKSVQMQEAAGLALSKGATPQLDAVSGETTFSWTESFAGPLSKPPPFTPGAPPTAIAAADPAGMQQAVRLRLTTCTVRRTVWVPDEFTIAERAILARNGGMGGIAMWAFGYDTSDLWNVLASPSVTGG